MTTAAHPLGDPTYVNFTTFRRSGEAVTSPVWFAWDGEGYVFTTNGTAGKVKRLRHTSRVEITRSDVRGRVKPGTPTYRGTAEIISDDAARAVHERVLAKKYGIQWKFVGLGDVARKLTRQTVDVVVIRTVLDPVGD